MKYYEGCRCEAECRKEAEKKSRVHPSCSQLGDLSNQSQHGRGTSRPYFFPIM